LLGVKAWQVVQSAEAMRPLIGPETFVVPLQNGVEAATQLATVLGASHVIGGLCGTLSWVSAPGRIRSVGTTNNFIRFAELDNRASERTERLRQAFVRGAVNVEVPTDITKALWDKFMMVTSFGGVGAVARAPIGVIRSIAETRELLARCLSETAALAKARHVALNDGAVAATLAFYDGLPPSGTTSLQRDIADGKPSELESWNGAIVRLARESGVAAPTHDLIYRMLLPLEKRARGELTFPT
jgi:2-dehydropantoate 2-reductase